MVDLLTVFCPSACVMPSLSPPPILPRPTLHHKHSTAPRYLGRCNSVCLAMLMFHTYSPLLTILPCILFATVFNSVIPFCSDVWLFAVLAPYAALTHTHTAHYTPGGRAAPPSHHPPPPPLPY